MKGSASGQDSLLERVIAAEERQPLPRNSGATAECLALETLLALDVSRRPHNYFHSRKKYFLIGFWNNMPKVVHFQRSAMLLPPDYVATLR